MTEKIIKSYSERNIEGLSSLLEAFVVPGKMRIYNIPGRELKKCIFSDKLIDEECCIYLGETDIGNWEDLAKFIGEKESDLNKKEYQEYESFSNSKLTKLNSIIFLYSDNVYVFSYLK